MGVLKRVVGTVLGLLVAGGCSGSLDPSIDPPGGTDRAGAGGATEAFAGSNAGGGRTPGGGGGLAGSGRQAGDSPAGGGGLAGGGGAPVHRFSIRFDYRFDTLGFFAAPERRAALEAAGALWSNVIRDDFDAVPKGTAIRTRNPENRDEYLRVESIEEDVDDLLVFVGTSEAILGLGRGGPSGTATTNSPTLDAALAARRDGADFEPWAGSISFKASTNFFFDPTPDTSDDIPRAAFDFISTAAHELGHVLGFANSAAFTGFTSETTFIGPKALANYGGPVPLTTDLGHFQDHLQSDGWDTLMDPGISNGVRLLPTQLDRALLADLGYDFSN